jgi:hypothetical protein
VVLDSLEGSADIDYDNLFVFIYDIEAVVSKLALDKTLNEQNGYLIKQLRKPLNN